jgi:hypothetical protein
MKFDIAVSYLEDVPEQLILEFANDLKETDIKIEIEKRPNSPFAIMEWALPTIIIFIFGSFFKGFFGEMGKDSYNAAKDALKKLTKKSLEIDYKLIVSEQSPNKIDMDSPVSHSFSILAKTVNERPVKFLFYRDKDDEYNNYLIDLLFYVLENHHRNYPEDKITIQANKLSNNPREIIYLLFDESTKEWKVADISTGNFVKD